MALLPYFRGMWRKFLFSGIFLVLTIWLGYFVERGDFPALIGAYTLFFLLYWKTTDVISSKNDIRFWILLGVLLRAVLLFSLLNLSKV